MTYEYARAFGLILAFVILATLLSRALSTPVEPMVFKPRVVKTIAINKDDIYDAGMAQ